MGERFISAYLIFMPNGRVPARIELDPAKAWRAAESGEAVHRLPDGARWDPELMRWQLGGSWFREGQKLPPMNFMLLPHASDGALEEAAKRRFKEASS